MKNKAEISQDLKERIEKTFPQEKFLMNALVAKDVESVIIRLKGLTSTDRINFSARDIMRLFDSECSEVIKQRAYQVIKGEEFLSILTNQSLQP